MKEEENVSGESMLSNFYSGFTNGPYTVKPYPQRRHTHCVFDGNDKAVISGTEKECENFKERFNTAYAKHIMLKDIPAKDAKVDVP